MRNECLAAAHVSSWPVLGPPCDSVRSSGPVPWESGMDATDGATSVRRVFTTVTGARTKPGGVPVPGQEAERQSIVPAARGAS